VFEALRKEVLALDPCIREEFLKLYVAYKAETNFVDVVPQSKRLRLSLNIPFAELNDPKGICKNNAGHKGWGNGEVVVELKTLDELPYIMGLVRQSLERQMSDGASHDCRPQAVSRIQGVGAGMARENTLALDFEAGSAAYTKHNIPNVGLRKRQSFRLVLVI